MAESLDIELGRSGLSTYDGTVHDEKLRQLSSPDRRARTYREMADNDPVIGAVLFVVDMLIRQLEWHIEPYDQDVPRDLESAEFVESCFEDLNRPFKDVISEALSVLVYGWSWHEIVFKKRLGDQGRSIVLGNGGEVIEDLGDPQALPPSKYADGRIGWHKMAGRAQETLQRWHFDSHGELVGMVQAAPPTFNPVFIPLSKSLHFRTSAMRNNPEGRSILRNAYRPWYFKKVIEEIQAIGIERDLAGLPVLYVPEELMRRELSPANQALRNELEQMVRNIRRGNQEGILAPRRDGANGGNLYELSLLSTGGRRQFNIKETLEYYDQRIAMTSLADFVLLGHEAVGSFALADSKTNIFTMATNAWIDVISDQFNDKAIPQLLRLNGLDQIRAPRLAHSDIESVDLDQLGKYVATLASAGMPLFPNVELEEYLRGQAKLPGSNSTEL